MALISDRFKRPLVYPHLLAGHSPSSPTRSSHQLPVAPHTWRVLGSVGGTGGVSVSCRRSRQAAADPPHLQRADHKRRATTPQPGVPGGGARAAPRAPGAVPLPVRGAGALHSLRPGPLRTPRLQQTAGVQRHSARPRGRRRSCPFATGV